MPLNWQRTDLDQLDCWSRKFPGCGWRVVMEGSGIWALDVDVPSPDHTSDGVKALIDLVKIHGSLPPRGPMTRSGGGGYGLFFRYNGEPISGKTGTPGPGLDPRRGRLSLAVPPSIHLRTRLPYLWIVAPWEESPSPAPAWLLRLVAPPPLSSPEQSPRVPDAPEGRRRYALAALRRAANRVALAPRGSRNDALNAETFGLTRFLVEGSLDASEIATEMAYAGRQSGLLPAELKATLTSALAAGARR